MNRIDRELIDAARESSLPEVRRLLRAGAVVNANHEFNGFTPLHLACSRGHVQVFKELLEHGADIDAKDNEDCTPLHNACANGHVAVVNELMSPNNSNGATTTILGKRKSRGADIEAKDREGNTPLHFAGVHDHLPVVKALLSGGADISAVNNLRELPVHRAMSRGNSAVAKYLLQEFYGTIRRLPLLQELLEDLTFDDYPPYPPLSDDYREIWEGVPPLRFALDENVLCTDDVVEILEYLVDRNPELLSSFDQDGSLPLHVACRRGASFAIVQSLVNLNKASVKSVTSEGDLPLFLACEMPKTSLDTIFLLMKLYPDLVYL
jgi:ankyrin repeat protein